MWMRLKRKLKDRWNFGGKEDRENQKNKSVPFFPLKQITNF
jgi:hypothetical protein